MKLIILSLISFAACGGSGGDAKPADAKPVDATAVPLACTDYAYCSTYSVHRYLADVPTPMGGTIQDGIYRLAWEVVPTNVNESPGQDYADTTYMIRGDQFVAGSFGGRGTITISGSHATFTSVAHCTMGMDDGASTTKIDQDFTATADQLILFDDVTRSDGVKWKEAHVLLREDISDVCTTVASQPTDPGDSYMCRVSNCACNAAVGKAVPSCT